MLRIFALRLAFRKYSQQLQLRRGPVGHDGSVICAEAVGLLMYLVAVRYRDGDKDQIKLSFGRKIKTTSV